MTAADRLPAWQNIVERMTQALPTEAPEQAELAALHDGIAQALHDGATAPEELESRLRAFAGAHPQLVVTAVGQITTDIYQAIAPQAERLRKAKEEGTLTDADRAAARECIAVLEACQAIFTGMSDETSQEGERGA